MYNTQIGLKQPLEIATGLKMAQSVVMTPSLDQYIALDTAGALITAKGGKINIKGASFPPQRKRIMIIQPNK